MKNLEWVKYLPEWAKYDENEDTVVVDPDVVYPMILKKIESVEPSLKGISKKPTRNVLEVGRLAFTRIIKHVLYTRKNLGDIERVYIKLKILAKDKKWALINFPLGKPINKPAIYQKLGIHEILN